MARGHLNDALARRKMREGAVRGLAYAARYVGDQAVARTPRDSGDLRRSERDYVDGEELKATIAYSAPYAVVVHESGRAHKDGQSKFLETALSENAPRALSIIANEIRAELGT